MVGVFTGWSILDGAATLGGVAPTGALIYVTCCCEIGAVRHFDTVLAPRPYNPNAVVSVHVQRGIYVQMSVWLRDCVLCEMGCMI